MSAVSTDLDWLNEHLIHVVPVGWKTHIGADGVQYLSLHRGFAVIVSGAVERDGKRWIHFSASHRDRIPTWDELRELKNLFLGREVLALQVLPPESRYINIYAKVLHLWTCLDGDPVPDFARGGTTI